MHELKHFGSHPRSHQQMLAIALENQRRTKPYQHRAMGGPLSAGFNPGGFNVGAGAMTPPSLNAPTGVMPMNTGAMNAPGPVAQPMTTVGNGMTPGARDQWAQQFRPEMQQFRTAMQGWHGNRPEMQGNAPQQRQAAMQAWRQQRPEFQNYFQPPNGGAPPRPMPPTPAPGQMPMRPPSGAFNAPGFASPLGATRPAMARGGDVRQHLDSGGFSMASPSTPFYDRSSAREMSGDQWHPGGLIESDAAGRTDRLPYAVAADSFVFPADVVSGLGQGNTLAGAKILNSILNSGAPYGAELPHHRRASGGSSPGDVSHVILAGGEYLGHRDRIEAMGAMMRRHGKSKARTDLAAGHEWARSLVENVRKHSKKFLRDAPNPKR